MKQTSQDSKSWEDEGRLTKNEVVGGQVFFWLHLSQKQSWYGQQPENIAKYS